MPAKSISGPRVSSRKVFRASQVSYSDAFEASSTTTISEAASVAVQRHFVRQLRQLTSKQVKQRAAITAEEQHDFEDLTQMEKTDAISITTFETYRSQFEKDQERKQYYSTVWTDWFTEEHIDQVVLAEEQERHQIYLQECRMRVTLHKLRQMEEEPLMWKHALHMVVFAEMVRRVAFYRQELDAAMAMNIPGYDAELLTVEGISDRKLDWMKNVCCPFRFADDCPFFPARILESLQEFKAKLGGCCQHSQVNRNSKANSIPGGASDELFQGRHISNVSTGSGSHSVEGELRSQNSFQERGVGLSENKDRKAVTLHLPRQITSQSPLTPYDTQGSIINPNMASSHRLPALSRANLIAIKSTLNQGHYKKSKCSVLPAL